MTNSVVAQTPRLKIGTLGAASAKRFGRFRKVQGRGSFRVAGKLQGLSIDLSISRSCGVGASVDAEHDKGTR